MEEGRGRVHTNVGCDNCVGTGFRGRKAIFELMNMNSHIRELAFNLAPLVDLRRAAIAAGMRSLAHDGKIKILNGVTTPNEIAHATQVDNESQREAEAKAASA